MTMSSTSKGLDDAAIADLLEGVRIGGVDGTVICDGCSARLDFGGGADANRAVESVGGYAMTPRNRSAPWKLSYVYCPDCNATDGHLGTRDVDEAAIEFEAVLQPETQDSQPVVKDVSVVERNRA